ERNGWVHVDGAFGLWAATSPALRHLVHGVERADSWATDGHKWLNVPYDSGIAIVRDAAAHKTAMTGRASYLVQSSGAERDPQDWTPEFSRRARGFAVYAALKSLGRDGVTALVERCCRLARRMADRLAGGPGVRILNEVVLNQVLVRFEAPGADADAVAVMALERVPADIRKEGGVARMADAAVVGAIMDAVTIPVMAKCRIGHFAEARVLEALGVDFIDESEVLTPADEEHHVDKHAFAVPFVCGARDLGEALRRIGEGAALIRTKGEAGTGNIVEAVRHMRAVMTSVRRLATLGSEELMHEA